MKYQEITVSRNAVEKFARQHSVGSFVTIQVEKTVERYLEKPKRVKENVRAQILQKFPFIARTNKGDFSWSELYILNQRAMGVFDGEIDLSD